MPQEVNGYEELKGDPVVTGETDTQTGEEVELVRDPVYLKEHSDGVITVAYVLDGASAVEGPRYKAYAVTLYEPGVADPNQQIVGAELRHRLPRWRITSRHRVGRFDFTEIGSFRRKDAAKDALVRWMRQDSGSAPAAASMRDEEIFGPSLSGGSVPVSEDGYNNGGYMDSGISFFGFGWVESDDDDSLPWL